MNSLLEPFFIRIAIVMSLRNRAKRAYKLTMAATKRATSRSFSRFSPAPDTGPLLCAGMVRNERDIIDVWIAHLLALFDRIVIIDHLSTDGTRERLHEIAALHPALEVRHHDDDAHIQAKLMSGILDEVSTNNDRGWVFFLDSDEFLMVESRAALDAVLRSHHRAVSVRSVWAQGYPSNSGQTVRPDTQVLGWHHAPCVNSKIAVNLSYAKLVARIEYGNHHARYHRYSFLRHIDALHILHLPIRSGEQIESKVSLGLDAANKAYLSHPGR